MQTNKNVLLIVPYKLDKVGGIETYNKLLIKIIKNNFLNINIDILLTEITIKQINKNEKYDDIYEYHVNNFKCKNIYINWFLSPLLVKKTINQLLNKKKYSLIINSTSIYLKQLARLNNYFLIQHNSFNVYKFKEIKNFSNFIKKISRILLFQKFPFDKTKNVILFDNDNKELYFKLFNNNANIHCIALCSQNKKEALDSKQIILNRENIIYFGRLGFQKNIKGLININNDLNKIDFYGSIEPTKYCKEVYKVLQEKKWYKGVLDQNNLYTTINKYKFSINYSFFEGFSFSIVESLSCGVPVIVKDSFTSASFLTSYDHRLLIPKNATNEEAIKQINSLLNLSDEEYLKLCKKALKFFQENLSYEIFEKNWLEIFNKFLN
ncbi:MAG: glycosyltransferase [Mycoplasmataceae bacterium]|nr:glycosyltransferase [Mycoplasmataceae bacterium]